MTIGSINSVQTTDTSIVSEQLQLANSEKLKQKQDNAQSTSDTVEISDDAQALYAQMRDNENSKPEVDSGIAENTADAGQAMNESSGNAPAEQSASGSDSESEEEIEEEIEKLEKKIEELNSQAGSEDDDVIQSKIRSYEAQIAEYELQKSQAQ